MIVLLWGWAFMAIVVTGGIALICLVRVSRRQRNKLRSEGFVDFRDVLTKKPVGLGQHLRLSVFGPQPGLFEVIFRIVTIATAMALFLAVGALFVFVGYQILKSS